MKYTLLDLTQAVLSSMDSDEVNSISDTAEAMQVAQLIRGVYYDLVDRANLPEHYSLVSLDASGDADKPTLMYLPSTVAYLKWLKYNSFEIEDEILINMKDVTYLSVNDFLERVYSFDPQAPNVGSFQHEVGADTFTILFLNDTSPTYYTTFDDNTVVFDSFDIGVDTTLQKSKTLGCGRLVIPFSLTDSFVPDLDDTHFGLLLNEAKALAWIELKQTQHPKAEQNARRGWVRTQKDKKAIDNLLDFERLPNFGRK